jgi:hypothetical protein
MDRLRVDGAAVFLGSSFCLQSEQPIEQRIHTLCLLVGLKIPSLSQAIFDTKREYIQETACAQSRNEYATRLTLINSRYRTVQPRIDGQARGEVLSTRFINFVER